MAAEISLANQLRAFARYAGGLPSHLREPLELEACRAKIRRAGSTPSENI